MQTDKQMTLKEWIITIILLFLPIVSLVMLIIWATDKKDPRNNFAKAYLIVAGGMFALIIIFYIIFFFFIITMGFMVS